MSQGFELERNATEPSNPATGFTRIYVDTDGDVAYKRPDGSVGKLKGGGVINMAGYDLTLGADVTLAGSVAGGGTVSIPTGETAAFLRSGTPMVRGTNTLTGRVPVFGTNTDVLDASEDLSFNSAQRRMHAYRAQITDYLLTPQAQLTEQSSTPSAVASHTVLFVDSGGDLCWRKDGGDVVKLAAAGAYTLTIPATGTAALLETAQTFIATKTFSNALVAPGMKPAADSATAIQLQNAAGTAVLTANTTANKINVAALQIGGVDMAYAAGTWTPELQFGGASTGITYSARTARYFRFGPLVFVVADIRLSSKGSATGNATITGLPLTSTSNPNSTLTFRWVSMTSALVTMVGGIADASSSILLYGATAATATIAQLTDAAFGNSTILQFSGVYQA